MKILTNLEIKQLLPTWTFQNDFIQKEFLFDDFKDAFCFMTKVAFHSEIENHHPEWSNIYNKVIIKLTTHDSSCVTEKDIKLAILIDSVNS